MNRCFMRRDWVSPFGGERAWGNMTEFYEITDPEAEVNSELLSTTSHSTREELVWEMSSSKVLLMLLWPGVAVQCLAVWWQPPKLCWELERNCLLCQPSGSIPSWPVLAHLGILGQQLTKPVWFILCGRGKNPEHRSLGREPPNFAVLMWKPVLEAKHG